MTLTHLPRVSFRCLCLSDPVRRLVAATASVIPTKLRNVATVLPVNAAVVLATWQTTVELSFLRLRDTVELDPKPKPAFHQ